MSMLMAVTRWEQDLLSIRRTGTTNKYHSLSRLIDVRPRVGTTSKSQQL